MILAVDASTSVSSVALVSGGKAIAEISVNSPRGRGGRIFEALQEVVQMSTSLDRIVVGVGPGTYNGIRSAIAACWGIATAREVPLVGVSSLLALDEGRYQAVGDARREQFYFATVSSGRFEDEPRLLQAHELFSALRPGLPIFAPSPLDILPDALIRLPNAARLAALGAAVETSTQLPEPLYLKPAFITTPS